MEDRPCVREFLRPEDPLPAAADLVVEREPVDLHGLDLPQDVRRLLVLGDVREHGPGERTQVGLRRLGDDLGGRATQLPKPDQTPSMQPMTNTPTHTEEREPVGKEPHPQGAGEQEEGRAGKRVVGIPFTKEKAREAGRRSAEARREKKLAREREAEEQTRTDREKLRSALSKLSQEQWDNVIASAFEKANHTAIARYLDQAYGKPTADAPDPEAEGISWEEMTTEQRERHLRRIQAEIAALEAEETAT